MYKCVFFRTFAAGNNYRKMKKKPFLKINEWRQSLRQKMQSAKQWTDEHVEEWHHKQESYGEEAEAAGGHEGIQGRITFLTVIRIILAELGETEYWRTIGQLFWRPGYMISDFLNGKRRRYLKPFQLLIGTSILLAVALTIVPASVEKAESIEVNFAQKLAAQSEELTEKEKAKLNPIRVGLKYVDKYRHWKEEHMALGLLTASIMSIFFTWLLFRKSSRRANDFVQSKDKKANYNFPEILTILIFVAAQLQFVNTIWVLVVGWYKPMLSLDPFVFDWFVTYIIMFIDYQQLFGRKWYSTLWRTFICII